MHEAREWNEVVRRLRVITLTPEGERIAAMLVRESEVS